MGLRSAVVVRLCPALAADVSRISLQNSALHMGRK